MRIVYIKTDCTINAKQKKLNLVFKAQVTNYETLISFIYYILNHIYSLTVRLRQCGLREFFDFQR